MVIEECTDVKEGDQKEVQERGRSKDQKKELHAKHFWQIKNIHIP